jgi:hypothetical protein
MTMETDNADALSHETFGMAVPGRSSLNTQSVWEEKR